MPWWQAMVNKENKVEQQTVNRKEGKSIIPSNIYYETRLLRVQILYYPSDLDHNLVWLEPFIK